MMEGLKLIKPWKQGTVYSKYLTFIDLFIPLIDFCYILFFIPGVIVSFFNIFYIVGPITLFVFPMLLMCYYLMDAVERKAVLEPLKIGLKYNLLDFFIFLIIYQTLISFSSFWGYCQELTGSKRVWGK
jgi:biofilm PGA synthesis N-glycosyltransferase PgaC